LVDAHALEFQAEFDAVFSNAALHWMPNPDAVVAGVRRALRPGGRFVGEFGGRGNVAAICTALLAVRKARGYREVRPLPWYFPSAGKYADKLRAHGFTVDSSVLIPRPTPLPTDMRGWLETFARPFLNDVPPEARGAFLEEVSALLAPSLRDESGDWFADYVRLRFAAHL
jgi:SAM-dependent methyltransferase